MLHKVSKDTDPEDWFYSAADRLKVADLAWKEEGLTLSGIELLQEAVERFLKGYLIAKGWPLKRTHDLDVLLSDAITYDKRFKQFEELADQLTRDFFAQHYPGGDWTKVGQNYEVMRQKTGDLVGLIKSELPQFFTQTNKTK